MAVGKYQEEQRFTFVSGRTTGAEIMRMTRLQCYEPEARHQLELYAKGRDQKRQRFLAKPKNT
jgi:hypothetical protein